MRITYAEGVGIPIENLSDEEVAKLLGLIARRRLMRAAERADTVLQNRDPFCVRTSATF